MALPNGCAPRSRPASTNPLSSIPTLRQDWWQDNLADGGGVRELVERVTEGCIVNVSRLIGRQVARRLTLFIFALLTLFFLCKEGQVPTRQLLRAATRAYGPGSEDDLAFITKARQHVADGLTVYYTSWW
jgi:hypothetical protein